MPNISKSNLAKQIAGLKKTLNDTETVYKTKTTKLIELVGDTGETFATELGAVQVTQRTTDRIGTDLVVSFDNERYLALDRRTQNRLQALGVVKVDRKTITGQAPKVTVRLV